MSRSCWEQKHRYPLLNIIQRALAERLTLTLRFHSFIILIIIITRRRRCIAKLATYVLLLDLQFCISHSYLGSRSTDSHAVNGHCTNYTYFLTSLLSRPIYLYRIYKQHRSTSPSRARVVPFAIQFLNIARWSRKTKTIVFMGRHWAIKAFIPHDSRKDGKKMKRSGVSSDTCALSSLLPRVVIR